MGHKAPVAHTDDAASADNRINCSPRLRAQVKSSAQAAFARSVRRPFATPDTASNREILMQCFGERRGEHCQAHAGV